MRRHVTLAVLALAAPLPCPAAAQNASVVSTVVARQASQQNVGTHGPGSHTLRIGDSLASGVYWIRLSTTSRAIARKAQITR